MAVADPPREQPPIDLGDQLESWPYRFEIVPLEDLVVDQSYQRPLTSFWKTVSEKFNPALVGTLVVSERGRRKNVVDGQTRLTAMRERGIHGAPCLIYEGLSRKQEAQLFALLQTQRRAMRSYDRFRAELVAGEPVAVGVSRIAEEVGYKLSAQEEPLTLRAVTELEKLYNIGDEHLRDVLELTRDIWGLEDRDAVSKQILGGLSSFVRTQKNLDYDRLRKRLHDVTPKLIINRAAQIREGAGYGTGTAKSVAQAILAEYMRRR